MKPKIDFDPLRDRWAREAAESDLGLWWLADDVRETLGSDAGEADVRAATLEAVQPLLKSGNLRAVTLLENGTFEVWPGDADEQLALIAEQWIAVGKPDIGDVVWFIGERAGKA